MELKRVEVKKVQWTKAKTDPETLEERTPEKLILTLEISDPDIEQVTPLLTFAQQGLSNWTIAKVQRAMGV